MSIRENAMAEHMASVPPATALGPRLATGAVAMAWGKGGIRLDCSPLNLTQGGRTV
ncbi:hypothetical protein [Actinacidiphila acididurans]|uniref:Uncharacterized protein n=1 Tax=Actinacidiphila acididurans TaxID=2784346 RepID=A0ABS2TXA4_9ACTN|nr:hypothetical protein [Actinacidiphila acididurans]MBM9507964.1 hypothetical protein [Actinacidiphila acididurans]